LAIRAIKIRTLARSRGGSPRSIELLQAHTDDAISRGAKLEIGGKRLDRPGWFFEPDRVQRR